MTLPNFLIIGAAKAGTTAIAEYLKQHPQIYMSSVKEPFFFSFEGQKLDFRGPGDSEAFHLAITDLADYRQLFQGVENEVAIGEASTTYLYTPNAAERIHHYIPNVKLIAILRNPVERAYASYLHLIRDGNETIMDFSEALDREQQRINDNWMLLWHYQQVGFYYSQLNHYYNQFDPQQIKVYLYDDFKADALGLIKDILSFLNVDDTYTPDLSIRYNVSGIPKNRFLHNLISGNNVLKKIAKPLFPRSLKQLIRTKNLEKPEMSKEVRERLVNLYREDIVKLQDLINRDLSQWLKV
ncbi:MAG: sulfotransferase [Cyanobacteria bacterium J06592_8]